jgi:hypothetical protein
MMKIALTGSLCMLAILSIAAPAQRPQDARIPVSRKVPIRVALVLASEPLEPRTVVLRRINQRPHDVVLVDARATAQDLAAGRADERSSR